MTQLTLAPRFSQAGRGRCRFAGCRLRILQQPRGGREQVAQREAEHRRASARPTRPASASTTCSSENLVALCDIDDNYLDKAAQGFSAAQKVQRLSQAARAERHRRGRRLHARPYPRPGHGAGAAAGQARLLRKAAHAHRGRSPAGRQEAAKAKVATQMGTQIHAGDNYRRVVEIMQSGAIGKVAEVHTWAGRGWDRRRPARRTCRRCRPTLHWDLWLGPAPERPYNPAYVPATLAQVVGFWRRQHGRHGLPSHGPAVLGPGPAPSDERRGRRPAGRSRTLPAGPDRELRVSGARRAAGGEAHLVRRRPHSRQDSRPSQPVAAAICSSATRACCGPTTARISCCPRPTSPATSRPSRRSRARSAITPNGSRPARPAARPPATSTTPAR